MRVRELLERLRVVPPDAEVVADINPCRSVGEVGMENMLQLDTGLWVPLDRDDPRLIQVVVLTGVDDDSA